MDPKTNWLDILDGATSYSDLQNAFRHMMLDSQTSPDSEAMIASIDEAIRRIEQERARDQAELDGFESDYKAFKQEQSGVIGWFKRKMPFTETRKKELGHRDTLSDQQAEVLADNFVIARAQMLKERIAPQKLRKMGAKPHHWREKLLSFESQDTIRDYGRVILDLGNELLNATAFLATLQSDIESFSSARFSSNEDQKRSHEDLKVAKEELKHLFDESQEKQSLKEAALVNLKALLVQDLSEKDSGFKQTHESLVNLQNLQTMHPRLNKALADCLTMTKSIVSNMIEKNKLPEQSAKMERSIRTLKRDYEDAEEKKLKSAREFVEPNQLYQAAMSEWQRADSALKATKSLYDAYIAEQAKRDPSTAAEVTSNGDFEVSTSSNVVAEYRRLEENAAQAKRELDSKTSAFEQAKRHNENAAHEAKELQSKLETQTVELKNLIDKESLLQQLIDREEQNLDSLNQELNDSVQSFVRALLEIPRFEKSHPSVRSLQALIADLHGTGTSLPTSIFDTISLPFQNSAYSSSANTNMARARSRNVNDTEKQSERLELAITEVDKLLDECKKESARLTQLRKETLQRKGQMLLDQRVLNELDFDEVE